MKRFITILLFLYCLTAIGQDTQFKVRSDLQIADTTQVGVSWDGKYVTPYWGWTWYVQKADSNTILTGYYVTPNNMRDSLELKMPNVVGASGTSLDSALWFNRSTGYTEMREVVSGTFTTTLTGDATGSGAGTIAVTVVDDLHNHVIGNVDLLQDSLTAKVSVKDSNSISPQHYVAPYWLDQQAYISANQTITLSSDVTGSGTTAIVATVVDDSHNHIIGNVDLLQDSLTTKVNVKDSNSVSPEHYVSPYWLSQNYEPTLTTGNLIESVAGLEFSAVRQVIGGTTTLTISSGYVIPTTTEQTNWEKAWDSTATQTTRINLAITKADTLSTSIYDSLGNIYTDGQTDALLALRVLISDSNKTSAGNYTTRKYVDDSLNIHWDTLVSHNTRINNNVDSLAVHLDSIQDHNDRINTITVDSSNNVRLHVIDAEGDLLIGTANNAVDNLAIGANDYVLTSNGTTAAWEAATGGGLSIDSLAFIKGTIHNYQRDITDLFGIGIQVPTAKTDIEGSGGSDTLLIVRNDVMGVADPIDTVFVILPDGKVGVGTVAPAGLLGLGSQEDVVEAYGITLGISQTSIEFVSTNYQLGYGFKIHTYDGGNGGDLLISSRSNNAAWELVDMRIVNDGSILALPTYSVTVGGTNADLYIDNTGLIGLQPSATKYKTKIKPLGGINWLYKLGTYTYVYKKDTCEMITLTDTTGINITPPDTTYTDTTYQVPDPGTATGTITVNDSVMHIAPADTSYIVKDSTWCNPYWEKSKHYGFVAEQVDTTNNWLMRYTYEMIGDSLHKKPEGVNTDKLFAPLVKSAQDQKEQLDALNPLISISTITTGGTATDTYTVNDTSGIPRTALASTIYYNSPTAIDFVAGYKQIGNGRYDGQIISITSFKNNYTITLDQGDNVKLDEGVTWVGGKGDEIVLKWVEGLGNWYERSRSNN